jgi:hypothetical protein
VALYRRECFYSAEIFRVLRVTRRQARSSPRADGEQRTFKQARTVQPAEKRFIRPALLKALKDAILGQAAGVRRMVDGD